MNKNDKLVVIFGVIILIVASVGISLYVPDDTAEAAGIDEVLELYGELKNTPDSLVVSDASPFYALIATPVAVHYDIEGKQTHIPLYVANITDPSRSVDRLRCNQLKEYSVNEYIIKDNMSAKEISLACAEKFWEKTNAALIMSMNKSGYMLGTLATPIASYLSIPVIVTDEIDGDVTRVLQNIGVTHTIICGDELSGYGKELHLNTVDEIVNATTMILRDKFGSIDYIALANPIDAWPPNVLAEETFSFGPVTLKSISQSKFNKAIINMITGNSEVGDFKIPDDYKYALIRLEGINHELEGVEDFGDSVDFEVTLADPGDAPTEWVITGSTGTAGNPIRDESGRIVKDRLLQESVLYDMGGKKCLVSARGSWAVLDQGDVSAEITVQKLDNPVYPLMKSLSSVAPYLTASHQGILFGKEEFAFTADDDIINDKGETCPGFYVPRRNSPLTPISNRHMFDVIHADLNDLLADLAGIQIHDDRDIEILQDHYKDNPVYIALVGGATVLPNFFYQNHVEPFGDVDDDGIDDTVYWVGGGTPSDVIYGNIDPIQYDWSNKANDIYTEYPFMENIVSRVTGWDAQDTSALIIRSLFYHDILKGYENGWKDTFGLLVGGGQDFQKPFLRQILFETILGTVSPGEPVKLDNGYAEQSLLRTKIEVAEPLGFDVETAFYEEAMRDGFTDEALTKLKQATLCNKIFFRKNQVSRIAGEGAVKGGEIYENSNFIFANGHGCQNFYGMAGNDLTSSSWGPAFKILWKAFGVPMLGGFIGPGGDLSKVGDYTCRAVSNMELGPSFMWLESCICGKIDGMYPKASSAQTHLHAGLAAMVASSTGSNIGGGYLDPKNMKFDNPITSHLKYWKNKYIDWPNEDFDDAHFGFKLYGDLCEDLRKNDVDIGLAFRNSRNNYFTPEEVEWEVWWTPPLIRTGNNQLDQELNDILSSSSSSPSGKGPMMESKYVSYQEYFLFGDPAFNPYEPINEG